MAKPLTIYNSLSRGKEVFEPLIPGKTGLYVCGPTVYSNAHLGHARPAVTFDLLYRYLLHLGYKVRYVRNITDVGHLEDEIEESGEDKIVKKARLEQLEPMEVVQKYLNTFHRNMAQLNTLPPCIEPRASAHIIEQQLLIKRILENGFAYEVNGSVYFDVEKYNTRYRYGILSGRNLEEMVANTRNLEGQEEKKNPFDFALWKKASPGHIMQWPSEWGMGFPGWHLECSAMSMKYLGEVFDIHGGGMDLQFPHHECEIAQSTAASGHSSVRYWMHNNMITINGQKMARSLGNFITLDELFSGNHPLLDSAYSPMTIRFFILQAHYRSTLDFSNEALQSAGKGLERLMKAAALLPKLTASATSTVDIGALEENCREAINDDLNSPILIAHLFDGVRIINQVSEGLASVSAEDLDKLKSIFHTWLFDILGLREENNPAGNSETIRQLVELTLKIRMDAKAKKDWTTSDYIRSELARIGISVKDKKEGCEWEMD
ncbi:MAG: cysteine--tRNA ligase [Prolixibacteraceae bacterium]|jgi:cysteinyl-tRNA synthetase|nr:MAG: Cysteine--tRNA ligase [Bacteroidetes bacterium ADurb.Bin123]HNU77172.1 cysteine--tRNA ligase [Prolixibacteraceae bacterium]HOF54693.1 cysteine--tRNA ligase [Prolixibacteraceae bacterium]HOR99663.1 cysteine--tRNA ligase [Prolixibacteraceae bacterium]HOS89080.1 cysteine--tRNA ligase [Prolixibacteraceae bacterium]